MLQQKTLSNLRRKDFQCHGDFQSFDYKGFSIGVSGGPDCGLFTVYIDVKTGDDDSDSCIYIIPKPINCDSIGGEDGVRAFVKDEIEECGLKASTIKKLFLTIEKKHFIDMSHKNLPEFIEKAQELGLLPSDNVEIYRNEKL